MDFYEIPVLCYGLRVPISDTPVSGFHAIDGNRRHHRGSPDGLLVRKTAQCNTRYANGKIVREGAQIFLGSNESYVALAGKHYKEGKLWKEDE